MCMGRELPSHPTVRLTTGTHTTRTPARCHGRSGQRINGAALRPRTIELAGTYVAIAKRSQSGVRDGAPSELSTIRASRALPSRLVRFGM